MTASSSEDFERVPCPECGGQANHHVALTEQNANGTGAKFAVVHCDDCGLTYANPRLSGPALSAAYAAFQGGAATDGPADVEPAPGILRGWWRHLTQRQLVGDWVEQGPVLDVGCHLGDLILQLKRRGFEASGIESSVAAVKRCQARGLDVVRGSIEESTLADGAYRTITLSHVLEHVADPVAVLKKLRRALVPGGRIIIAVPNHRGLVARLFGAHWHGWDPPFHLIHFDSSSLRRVLEMAGFRVERMITRGNPDDVTRSLGKMVHRRVDALWVRAALLPGSWLLGHLAQGGELCAVAERPLSAAP